MLLARRGPLNGPAGPRHRNDLAWEWPAAEEVQDQNSLAVIGLPREGDCGGCPASDTMLSLIDPAKYLVLTAKQLPTAWLGPPELPLKNQDADPSSEALRA